MTLSANEQGSTPLMRFEGKLDKWNDERGFGFITPTCGGEPVFVHISAFPRDGRRRQEAGGQDRAPPGRATRTGA